MKHLLLSILIFGFGISGSLGQTIKSLGFNTTNGQVVASTGTNPLTFTNRFGQSSTNATNPPEIRLTTKSNNVASWFVYDAVQTNPAAPNWSVGFLGLNTVPNATGTDRALLNQSIGGASFTIENMWVSPAPDPDAPLAEFYFNITDTNNLTTRGFSVIGNQTNSTVGFADFVYPLTIYYNSNSRAWYGSDSLGLNVFSTNTGELARFTHSTTNPSGTAQIYLQVQNNQTIWQAGLATTYMRNFGSGRNVFRADSNGVIYGATGANDAPQAPIHLAGNTRIDGAISFNATSNAAATRTNFGLGAIWLTNTNKTTFLNDIGALATNGSAAGLSDFPTLNQNTTGTASNVTGVVAISNGGTGANVASSARTNLGLGATWLTNTNVTNFRTAIGLGGSDDVSFSSVSAGQFEAGSGTNTVSVEGTGIVFGGGSTATTRTNLGLGATWLTNTNVANFRSAIGLGASNGPTFAGVTVSDLSNTNGADHVAWVDDTGTFFSINAAATRTNLGLGATWLTNTNVTNFRTAVGLGATNSVSFASVSANYAVVGGTVNNPATAFVASDGYSEETHYALGTIQWYSQYDLMGEINLVNQYFASPSLNSAWTFHNPIAFNNTTNAATTRTNLGLGGGITTNRTFVSYNGTNYTTNTVTISNGIITGWTQ